jgi:hypothetical protein
MWHISRRNIFDEEATLEVFGHNRRLLKEMLISFERLCSSRVLHRLQVGPRHPLVPLGGHGRNAHFDRRASFFFFAACFQEAMQSSRNEKAIIHEVDFLMQVSTVTKGGASPCRASTL